MNSIFNKIPNDISKLETHRPVKVAIDGITASGKSIFAQSLANYLVATGREVIHTSLDGSFSMQLKEQGKEMKNLLAPLKKCEYSYQQQ